MATKKYLSLDRLTEYDELLKEKIAADDAATLKSAKEYTDGLVSGGHNHDDSYYTESEIDSKLSAINTSITNITSGEIVVKEAEHAGSADEATHATSADSATTADSSTTAETATKATQDASGNVITETYETKADATATHDAMQAEIDLASATTSLIRPLSELANYGVVVGRNSIGGALNLNASINVPNNMWFMFDLEAHTTLTIYFNSKSICSFVANSLLIGVRNNGTSITVKCGHDYVKINYNENGEYVSDTTYYVPYIEHLLTKKNTVEYTPTSDYHPATKKYVDDNVLSHNHDDVYETKSDADAKYDELKEYADGKVSGLASITEVESKISTHNTSDVAHSDIRNLVSELSTKVNKFLNVDDATKDELSEVLELIENNKGTLESLTSSKVNVSDIVDNLTTSSADKVLSAKQGVALKALIDALQSVVDGKADEVHSHAISDVTGLQTALNESNTAIEELAEAIEVAKAEAIEAAKTDASNQDAVILIEAQNAIDAVQSSLDAHKGNTTVHITSDERTNWNAAKTHADSAHAPSNAQANVIESIKVNGTAQTITSKSVDITVPTKTSDLTHDSGFLVASDIENKADKATTLSGYGITDAYTKSEVDAKTEVDSTLSTTSTNPVQNKVVNSAIVTATEAIVANTNSINAHTDRISALESKVGEGFTAITSEEIQALFA